jgi:deoxyadenosine/deoxycytidine kinase
MATTPTTPVEVTMEETTRTRLQRLLASSKCTIQLEGGIASGKTTLLDSLRTAGYKVVEEAVASWGHLDAFYDGDGAKNAYPLQSEVLLSYDAAVCDCRGGFVERGPSSALSVFIAQQHEDGLLSDAQVELLKAMARELTFVRPTVVVYLYLDPDECFRRVISRKRGAEVHLERSYLSRLDTKYRQALAEGMTMPGEQRPHLVLVNVAPFENRLNDLTQHVEALVLEALTFLVPT